jgi:hypothetical protein
MGNASACIADLWAVENNQANLAYLKNPAAGVYYENRFLLKELSSKSVALALPVGTGVFGLYVNQFGYELYNESKFCLAYSKELSEKFSAGIGLDYLYTHIAEGYGSKGNVTFEAGIRSKLSSKLVLGAYIFNPVRARLSEYDDERLPTIMKLGLLYSPSSKVNIAGEVEKDVKYKADVRAGIEYNVTKNIFLRAGMRTFPEVYSFGFGINYKKLRFDFASSVHSVLGYSPQVSMEYEIK